MRDVLIERFGLQPHPEGGYFRETFRAAENVSRLDEPGTARSASTAIYYMLCDGAHSAWHRIRSDEVWHFYAGSSLAVYVIDPDGDYSELHLGDGSDEVFQAVVKAGCWFASRVKDGTGFALVGCTVAPGFDFADFELAVRPELVAAYPQHRKLIEELTRV